MFTRDLFVVANLLIIA